MYLLKSNDLILHHTYFVFHRSVKMKKVLALVFVVFLANTETFGQGVKKFQVWTDFTPSYNMNDKWLVSGEIGYRFQPSSGDQSAYIRPAINYKLSKILKFTVGIASFSNWDPGSFKSTELRTFEYVNLSWPKLGEFNFKHRLGLDQRWFYIPELGLDEFVHRSRYYVEVISPNFKVFGLNSPFFITANFEILRDITNSELGTLVDHNRYTFGFGNHITEQFRAEVRFKIISLVDPVTSSFVREINVIRVRLYYQFASS